MMAKNLTLNALRFADYVRPHEVIGWPQGPGEPLALTEALVAQRAELVRPRVVEHHPTVRTGGDRVISSPRRARSAVLLPTILLTTSDAVSRM